MKSDRIRRTGNFLKLASFKSNSKRSRWRVRAIARNTLCYEPDIRLDRDSLLQMSTKAPSRQGPKQDAIFKSDDCFCGSNAPSSKERRKISWTIRSRCRTLVLSSSRGSVACPVGDRFTALTLDVGPIFEASLATTLQPHRVLRLQLCGPLAA